MLRNVFKEKKISILYLTLILVFSLIQVYVLLSVVDYINYSIESFRLFFLKNNPSVYSNDLTFLSYFNEDLNYSWNSIINTAFFNDEVKKIIDISYSDVTINLTIVSSLIITAFINFILINLFTCLFSNQFQIVIKDQMFDKVFLLNKDEISSLFPLKLTIYSIYDVKRVSNVIEEFLSHFIVAIFLIIFTLMKMYKINTIFFYFTLTLIILFIILSIATLKYRFSKYKDIYHNSDIYSCLLNDLRIGRKENDLFSFSQFILRNVDVINSKQSLNKLKNSRCYYLFTLTNIFYFYISFIIVLFFSLKNNISIIETIYYLFFQFIIFYSLNSLRRFYYLYPEYIYSRKNIKKVLDYKIIEKNTGKSVTRNDFGEIIFEHVYFKYPGRKKYCLEDVSFKINCSSKCALLGESGSGKSTIVKLLNREYDIEKGNIYIDGINIKKIPYARLNIIVGILFEDDYIINSSLKDNIVLGNNSYSKENLDYAYNVSLLSNNNYFSKNNYNITHLSSGNKKQIQIARRMIKENEIFILDSIYSSIDYKNAKDINNKIFSSQINKTILCITNRIEILKDFNQILYLDQGKIIFDGNYSSFISEFKEYNSFIENEVEEERYAY